MSSLMRSGDKFSLAKPNLSRFEGFSASDETSQNSGVNLTLIKTSKFKFSVNVSARPCRCQKKKEKSFSSDTKPIPKPMGGLSLLILSKVLP